VSTSYGISLRPDAAAEKLNPFAFAVKVKIATGTVWAFAVHARSAATRKRMSVTETRDFGTGLFDIA